MKADLKLGTIHKLPFDPGLWVDRHVDHLFRFAMSRLRDAFAAEDAVQETLLAALQSRDRYQGRSSERTWLVGILKHKIFDRYRRKCRTVEIPLANSEGHDQYGPFAGTGEWLGTWCSDLAPTEWQLDAAALYERKEFWKTLDRCLSELPPRTARAFTLREIDGLSTAEVCDVLSLSPNNLWVTLHRARLRLRSSLETEWGHNKLRSSDRVLMAPAKPAVRIICETSNVIVGHPICARTGNKVRFRSIQDMAQPLPPNTRHKPGEGTLRSDRQAA